MLKNYTSTVPVERSVSMIEMMLARNGANQILKTYDQKGNPTGICFKIVVRGTDLAFKLPAKADVCRTVLVNRMSPRSRHKTEMVAKVAAQAHRTAWKILFDWVEAQMAMIELSQVDAAEVFLPYMLVDGSRTVYDAMSERGFKAMIGDGKTSKETP